MPYGKKSPTAMGHESAVKMGHESAMKMGHESAMKMESAKQERKNLMDDNPVARTAAGDRPWIAKHYKSGMNYGSPMKDKHSAMKIGHSPMEKHSKAQEKGLNKGLVSAIHLHDEFTKKNNIKHK